VIAGLELKREHVLLPRAGSALAATAREIAELANLRST
jgi:hypothetical protein